MVIVCFNTVSHVFALQPESERMEMAGQLLASAEDAVYELPKELYGLYA